MDIKKLSGFENLGGITPGASTPAKGAGPSFQDALKQVQNQDVNPAIKAGVPNGILGAAEGIKFSNHAIERMQSRGIRFTPESMARLNEAVSKASAKGSKDSLILMDDAALIVSVKNRTVVTVMDQAALKENVFTNIDSTVVM